MKTRPQILWYHMDTLIDHSEHSWGTLATTVREHYEQQVPEHARTIEWSGNKDAYQRTRLDAQTLRRFEDETKHGLPAELEPAICAALNELHYDGYGELMADLAEQHGLLAAPIPDDSDAGAMSDFGRLTKDIGEMYEAIAPALADGRITKEDAPLARKMLREIADVEGRLLSLRKSIHDILPTQDDTVVAITSN